MNGYYRRIAKTPSSAQAAKEKTASATLGNNPHLEKLQKIVATSPIKPGVYRWLNEKGDVLYVGKAKNIRSRLKSYVLKPDVNLGPWKIALIGNIADVDITVTDTELEALILEIQLIKELKPKYNVLMKDDKSYVYVRIATNNAYPSAYVTRHMEQDGAVYFGPYLSSYESKLTLDMLQDVLNYRVCKNGIKALNKADHNENEPALKNPCLDSQIGKCNGVCYGAISKEEHVSRIQKLIRFYRGDRKEITQLLKDEMARSAQEKKFERAAKLRDSLKYIESLEEKQIVSDTSHENIDVIGIALHTGKAHVVLLRERNGKLIGELHFALAGSAGDYQSVIEQFIPQYYAMTEDIPDTILIPEACDEMTTLEEWLSHTRDKKVYLSVPERGKKVKLLAMAQANAEQKVHQQLSKWEAAAKNIENALSDLQEKLGLPEPPSRIEGYDISHLSGTETVGSMVVTKNGKPANDQYRSFTIRTVKEGEIDDYKSLQEVLTRRLKHLSESLKEEESQMKKEQDVSLGKARKSEQEPLQELLKEQKLISKKDTIDYKNYIVARNAEDSLIGYGQLQEHEGKVIELVHLWTHEDDAKLEVRQLLARKIMQSVKKGKAYVKTTPTFYNFYNAIGFRHTQSTPKFFEEKPHKVKENEVVMIYVASEHKKDSSLSSKPDLLVIDGGKGQLSTIVSVLSTMKLDIPVIGLAKREEEVFLPNSSLPVIFEKDSQAKFLLMRLRDEAHRFANRHREKRGKTKAIHSSLDDVPGIGATTKQKLLKNFGSVTNMRAASDEELKSFMTDSQLQSLRKYL